MLRTVGWLFVSLLFGYCGGCMSVLGAPELGLEPEVPREVARDALERELANARALGFEEVRRGTRDGFGFLYLDPWPAEANSCFAFVAATWGPRGALPVSLEDSADTGRELARAMAAQNVAAVQVCVREPVSIGVRGYIEQERRGLYADPISMEWVMLAAPAERVGGNGKLNRGQVPRDGAGASDDAGVDELQTLLDSLAAEADAGR